MSRSIDADKIKDFIRSTAPNYFSMHPVWDQIQAVVEYIDTHAVEAQGWTRVEDGLPDASELGWSDRVLVRVSREEDGQRDSFYDVSLYSEEGFWLCEREGCTVTHWREIEPLPAPMEDTP